MAKDEKIDQPVVPDVSIVTACANALPLSVKVRSEKNVKRFVVPMNWRKRRCSESRRR